MKRAEKLIRQLGATYNFNIKLVDDPQNDGWEVLFINKSNRKTYRKKVEKGEYNRLSRNNKDLYICSLLDDAIKATGGTN